MTPVQARVVQAEADARAARTRLSGSVAAVQDRIRPATLVREARREFDEARVSARRVAGDNPRPLSIAGGFAAVLILGVPLLRWRRRRCSIKRAARIRGN